MGSELTLLAALLAGLAGSGHCVAMCGGMASLLSVRQHRQRPVRQALAYNVGRITSYSIAGLVVGSIGFGMQNAIGSDMPVNLRWLTGGLLVLVGLNLIGGERWLAPITRIGSALWKRIAPLAVRLLHDNDDNTVGVFALGMAWGWLPCGMTYAVLLAAVSTADPLHSAALMLAFGTGTLPAMLGSGLAGMKLRNLLQGGRSRQLAGALMIAIGVWTAQPLHWINGGSDGPTESEQATHHHG